MSGMKDNFGSFIFSFIFTIALLWIVSFFSERDGKMQGYIQCLQDMKHGKPPAYVLAEQADGTTKWESNKEKGK